MQPTGRRGRALPNKHPPRGGADSPAILAHPTGMHKAAATCNQVWGWCHGSPDQSACRRRRRQRATRERPAIAPPPIQQWPPIAAHPAAGSGNAAPGSMVPPPPPVPSSAVTILSTLPTYSRHTHTHTQSAHLQSWPTSAQHLLVNNSNICLCEMRARHCAAAHCAPPSEGKGEGRHACAAIEQGCQERWPISPLYRQRGQQPPFSPLGPFRPPHPRNLQANRGRLPPGRPDQH